VSVRVRTRVTSGFRVKVNVTGSVRVMITSRVWVRVGSG
jgi:hypothetical protein